MGPNTGPDRPREVQALNLTPHRDEIYRQLQDAQVFWDGVADISVTLRAESDQIKIFVTPSRLKDEYSILIQARLRERLDVAVSMAGIRVRAVLITAEPSNEIVGINEAHAIGLGRFVFSRNYLLQVDNPPRVGRGSAEVLPQVDGDDGDIDDKSFGPGPSEASGRKLLAV